MIVCKLQPYATKHGSTSPLFKLALGQVELLTNRKSKHIGNDLVMSNHVSKEKLTRLAMVKSIKIPSAKDQFSEIIPQQSKLENSSKGIDWNTNYLSHGWHRYIGRFPPQIVRTMINYCNINSGQTILDPFAGSGTTLVESQLLGINSIGYELSPLSALISKVKTDTKIDPVVAQRTVAKLIKRYDSFDKKNHEIMELFPEFPNRERWFNEKILTDVIVLRECIKKIRNKPIQELCIIAMSHLLRHFANVDGQVVRPEYKEKNWDGYNILNPIKRHLNRMISDLEIYQSLNTKPSSTTIFQRDARKMNELQDNSIDFIITSPPYGVRAISYLETHFLSFHLFNSFLKSSFSETKKILIGKEQISDELPALSELTSPSSRIIVKEFLNNNDKKIQKRGEQYLQYFSDMQDCIKQFQRVLKKNKFACFIIGDKIACGKQIPLTKIMKQIFIANGFEFVNQFDTKLVCNFTNSIVPWNDRIIQKDSIILVRKKN